MKKWILVLLVGILITLAGCGNNSSKLTGSEPPETNIQVGDETYQTILGTYCWTTGSQSVCVDTAGAEALLEGKSPIVVKPGVEIQIVMDYEPLPNEFHLLQTIDGEETEVEVENHRFTVPEEKGVYYYDYGVWWMDEKQENVSNGDAFYAFALEVRE